MPSPASEDQARSDCWYLSDPGLTGLPGREAWPPWLARPSGAVPRGVGSEYADPRHWRRTEGGRQHEGVGVAQDVGNPPRNPENEREARHRPRRRMRRRTGIPEAEYLRRERSFSVPYGFPPAPGFYSLLQPRCASQCLLLPTSPRAPAHSPGGCHP